MPVVTDPEKENKTESTWQKVDAIVHLILENDRYLHKNRSPELTQLIMAKYSISVRTAQRYIQDARREINKMGKSKKKGALSKAIRDREYLLQIAKIGIKDKNGNLIVKPNHKLALEILKDREELQGLYVEKIEQSGTLTMKNVDMSQFTEYGLERLKRGDPPEEVMLDPKSLKRNDGDKNSNTDSGGS